MLVLSNGLTNEADEGFLKVANSLVKRLKAKNKDIYVVSYERQSDITDKFIRINKFMLSRELIGICKKHKDVFYLPFPAKATATALRIFLLSCFTKSLRVALVLKTKMNLLGRLLLKLSGAEIVVFSGDAAEFYAKIVGDKRVIRIKTGVDTKKFVPVSIEEKRVLKSNYGFAVDKKIVLHVGHLNEGRNIRQLLKISQQYNVLLVISTRFKSEWDIGLREELLAAPNIRIIDEYVDNIEEIYQLADLYFFPVVESGRCIDVPLSCMEAAACGLPVITTDYGEMRELKSKNGFYFIDDFDSENINKIIQKALNENKNPREEVLVYDWDNAINQLV